MSALVPVIAVDGLRGVGKGGLCQRLAVRLGWHLLASGALYRLTALVALRRNLLLEDADRIAAVAASLEAELIVKADGCLRITLDGTEVSADLRTERCGNAASRVAALPAVRAALLQRQQNFRCSPGLIADGRDMGTVVFPDAKLKLFLTASVEERAQRRHGQLSQQGLGASLWRLADEIAERDARDSQRAVAPLRPALDAEILDTTHLQSADVCNWALTLIAQRLALPEPR